MDPADEEQVLVEARLERIRRGDLVAVADPMEGMGDLDGAWYDSEPENVKTHIANWCVSLQIAKQ